MILKLSFLFWFLVGCNPMNNTPNCESLSMKKFKGIPNSSYEFDQSCQGVKIKYTTDLCQLALNDLVQHNDLNMVKKKFGDPVEECFTGDDLKRFNKN